jgi:predicted NAD/FAD-binding protein
MKEAQEERQRETLHLLEGEVDPNATLQTFLDQHGFTPFFARHYILPMGAATYHCGRWVISSRPW